MHALGGCDVAVKQGAAHCRPVPLLESCHELGHGDVDRLAVDRAVALRSAVPQAQHHDRAYDGAAGSSEAHAACEPGGDPDGKLAVYAQGLAVFGCPARKPPPSKVEHIGRKCVPPETGPWSTYEYCGEKDLGLHHGDINARLAVVMHDEDDYGGNTWLHREDNHGATGANILFLDNRVLWVKAADYVPTRGRGKAEWDRVTSD